MKIKRIFYLVIACLLIVSCNKQVKDKQFRISGTIQQGNQTALVLAKLDTNGYKTIDTIFTDKKGNFSSQYPIDYSAIYKLSLTDNDFVMFFAEPKDDLKLTANVASFSSDYKIDNSKPSEQLKILNNENMIVRQKLLFMSDLLQQNRGQDTFNEVLAKVKEQYAKLQEEERQFTLDFIDKNIGSLASVVALYRTFDGQWLVYVDELDVYNKVLSGLKKTMPNNPQTIFLQNSIIKNQNLLKHIENGDNTGAK
ncbi:MAG: DUF4369 domain-containing protein [Bacteroidales bacterium]|jgi:hypothetical protein|nr:DUF4369 domain-containing protein [Bacteroidales bacterium]